MPHSWVGPETVSRGGGEPGGGGGVGGGGGGEVANGALDLGSTEIGEPVVKEGWAR